MLATNRDVLQILGTKKPLDESGLDVNRRKAKQRVR
jgi:hypothetical protein